MTARPVRRFVLIALGLVAPFDLLFAQCTGVNHVTWPAVNPVWDFCWVRPVDSSGPAGSGLELTDVRYKGTLILGRAHIPLLNVKYAPNVNACGGANLCYRDWLFSERDFQCSPCQDASGAAVSCSSPSAVQCTGTTTPASGDPSFCGGGQACTVCQHPGTDAGSFNGVAVEDFGTSLRLTSQCAAGWYRYIPVWEFFADGTIQARFDATSVDATCVANTHEHHAYWRLDFDVNGSAGNFVDELLPGGGTQRVTTERNFIDTSPARSRWRIGNVGSPFAVEVARNAGDGAAGDANLSVPNDFPIADGWLLAYNANEITDSTPVDGCGAGLNAFDTNQPVDGADIVLWVRAGALHQGETGGMAQDCSMVGPTIKVVSTTPPPPQAFNTLTAPCRIVDTRDAPGPYGGPALSGGAGRDFTLAGQCGLPLLTAKSVAVNLTVVAPASNGHFTAYPAGGGLPLASTLNFSAGQTRANNAVLPLGTGGAVTIFNASAGAAHVLIDVTGWFE